jgi:outer membrane protein assembly factor BamE (lipoprotein component of BamABCDE complex)
MRDKFLVVAVLLLVGCATTSRINRVSIGMTKQQVIAAMGNPNSSSGEGDSEELDYVLVNNPVVPTSGGTYAVRLTDGKVVWYGQINNRAGHWGPPTQHYTVDVNQN